MIKNVYLKRLTTVENLRFDLFWGGEHDLGTGILHCFWNAIELQNQTARVIDIT